MNGDLDIGYESIFAVEEQIRNQEFEKMRAELQGVKAKLLQTLKHVSAEQQSAEQRRAELRAELQTTRAELQGLSLELIKQGQIMNRLVNLSRSNLKL